MKYPRHLVLDFSKKSFISETPYWVNSYKTRMNLFPTIKPLKKNKLKNNKQQRKSFKSPFLLMNQFTNITFLRKEIIYTKLKYSRCPQYDIVSGGLAALLAAFIGFLIQEKFGLELLDSGDFYILFMYIVFGVFSLRPLVRIITNGLENYRFFSFKHILLFYMEVTVSFYQNLRYIAFKKTYSRYFNLEKTSRFISENEYLRPTWRRLCYIVRFLKNYPKKVD